MGTTAAPAAVARSPPPADVVINAPSYLDPVSRSSCGQTTRGSLRSRFMSALVRFFSSSVGTKVLIALTGLGFAGFLVTHLAANLLVLVSADAYNEYSHKLISNPLIYLAEAGLVLLFVTHAYKAITNFARNKAARPQGYDTTRRAGHTSRKTLASTTMIVTGTWLLLFIVIHLKLFKFGTWYDTPDGSMRDLARLVNEDFQKPFYVVFYVLSMAVVGLHLRHGLSSAFQSLGLNHPRYNGFILKAGLTVAVVMALGFAAIPIVIFLKFFLAGGRS
jgi:succinate dehydrogenase / fumarate reductase, cytochrome b subunit